MGAWLSRLTLNVNFVQQDVQQQGHTTAGMYERREYLLAAEGQVRGRGVSRLARDPLVVVRR
jgi:hypothetical protein